MTTIHKLDNDVINKIAAGEVVESPTAAIKELLENSIDAKASSIQIDIAKDFSYIAIRDNGIGMSEKDALLSWHRNTTSKIQTVEDVENIYTMGFRGEALSSISAISKLRITTSQHTAKQGVILTIEGGKILTKKTAPPIKGTFIEIEELFFNTPARKKYQKSTRQEQASVQKLIRSFALCYLDCAFLFRIDNKTAYVCTAQKNWSIEKTLLDRAPAFFPEEFCSTALFLDESWNNKRLVGFISPPTLTRPNKSSQLFFLNQRKIFSEGFMQTIKEGYFTAIDKDRYPLFCLHLHIPPQEVDVNIHPQKKLVKFQNAPPLFEEIAQLIENRLTQQRKENSKAIAFSTEVSLPKQWNQGLFFEKRFEAPPLFPKAPKLLFSFSHYALISKESALQEEEFLLCDIKAAYRKISFDSWQQKSTYEPLLFPLSLDVTFFEAEKITIHKQIFTDLAIELEPSGPNSFLINALPSFFNKEDIKDFIMRMLEHLPFQKKEFLYKTCQIACGVKRFSEEEKKSLLFHFLSCKTDLYCPLGKPLFVPFGEKEAKKIMESACHKKPYKTALQT